MSKVYLAIAFMLVWSALCAVTGAKLFSWIFGRQT